VVFFGRNTALIFPFFDSKYQQKDRLGTDPTTEKPFLQVSWNPDGILLTARTHFKTRKKYIMSSWNRN
jgi:hypothetical protein